MTKKFLLPSLKILYIVYRGALAKFECTIITVNWVMTVAATAGKTAISVRHAAAVDTMFYSAKLR